MHKQLIPESTKPQWQTVAILQRKEEKICYLHGCSVSRCHSTSQAMTGCLNLVLSRWRYFWASRRLIPSANNLKPLPPAPSQSWHMLGSEREKGQQHCPSWKRICFCCILSWKYSFPTGCPVRGIQKNRGCICLLLLTLLLFSSFQDATYQSSLARLYTTRKI